MEKVWREGRGSESDVERRCDIDVEFGAINIFHMSAYMFWRALQIQIVCVVPSPPDFGS